MDAATETATDPTTETETPAAAEPQADAEQLRARVAFTPFDLDELFSSHTLDEDQRYRTVKIRESARRLAQAIVDCTPAGADQSAAIRKVREAMMTANAAIALGGARA